MKSEAIRIATDAKSPTIAYLQLREYLQHVILRVLFEQKDLPNLIFHGGTALRIIHGLNRFSEDLDFHLKVPNEKYRLTQVISTLLKNLALQGYIVSDSGVKEKTVRSTFIKFEGLLFECGLTINEDEKLSIKLEVDANPPPSWQVERRLINVYSPFSLIHHDVPSFLSGKIHAILQRPYTKGRDFYDLIFLLSRWEGLQPNIPYLQNALQQTSYMGAPINEKSWESVLSETARSLNWGQIQDDIRPFVISEADSGILDLNLLLDLLS
ncbi:MAG: nucleotidyl transferase AbiEii/AbiGii toxin family protein [Candidatus Marinimicrobia bacterium]|nr:nucleotidyl transferase AbiEii/AbiGii toxin family protein [Candidatus Neomarinimicrobiota bacterium]